jgi:hypothetical protein
VNVIIVVWEPRSLFGGLASPRVSLGDDGPGGFAAKVAHCFFPPSAR